MDERAPDGWRVLVTPENDICYFNGATGEIRFEATECTPQIRQTAETEDRGHPQMVAFEDGPGAADEMQSPQKPGHFGQPLGEFWPKPKR